MKRLLLPTLFGIFGAIFLISLCFADLSGSLDEQHILLRIKPEGEVNVEAGGQPVKSAGVAKPVVTDIGQQRYEKYCHICHESGLAGAPKFGDKSDWAPRIAEGMDTLFEHALKGYKAMPPKGTCMDCSDEDLKKAIEYMISHSK